MTAVSVRQRIFLGFGVVLALLACLAIVAGLGLAAVSDEAGSVRAMTAVDASTNALVGKLSTVQARVLQFAVTERDDDRTAAEAAIGALDTGREAAAQGELAEAVDRYVASVRAGMASVADHRADAAALAKSATDLQTIVSAIAGALLRDPSPDAGPAALRLSESAHASAAAAARLLYSRNPADADIARKELETVRAVLNDLRGGAAGNSRVQRFIKGIQGPLDDAGKAVEAASAHAEAFLLAAAKRQQDAQTALRAADARHGEASRSREQALALMLDAVSAARRFGLIAAGAAAVAGIALAWAIGNSVAGPVRRLTASMRALAAGDTATDVPHAARRDEIGAMARSVQVFKDNMIEADALRAAREEAKRQAEAERKGLLNGLADRFEAGVQASLGRLADAAPAMVSTAAHMSGIAERVSVRAGDVARAAGDASVNVQAVAAATEELAVSVQEIGRQVAQSTSVTRRAVSLTDETGGTAEQLTEAAHKIKDVVSLISGIAGQTNLLALNATIEAARAGEAGKGFAVVASEVKTLANQTAKATEAVNAQVTMIQDVTERVMRAIHGIGETVGSIDQVVTTIAAAVEEQSAATQEIARNVQAAAEQTNRVAATVTDMSEAAAETNSAAGKVSASAADMRGQTESLRASVAGFLGNVRAA